jgi:hypothetical protein
VSYIVKEDRNILHKITGRKGNCTGHILRRNCLLKHAIGGNIQGRNEEKEANLSDYWIP